MSHEAARAFLGDVTGEVIKAAQASDDPIAAMTAAGEGFTAEELREVGQAMTSQTTAPASELSDDALEKVAGGCGDAMGTLRVEEPGAGDMASGDGSGAYPGSDEPESLDPHMESGDGIGAFEGQDQPPPEMDPGFAAGDGIDPALRYMFK